MSLHDRVEELRQVLDEIHQNQGEFSLDALSRVSLAFLRLARVARDLLLALPPSDSNLRMMLFPIPKPVVLNGFVYCHSKCPMARPCPLTLPDNDMRPGPECEWGNLNG